MRATAVVLGVLAAIGLPMASGALPAAPTIAQPTDGSIRSGLHAVTIAGNAAAASTVTVTDALGGVLGTTTADGSGAWSISRSLAAGTHTITATASDAGATSPPSTPVTFEVDADRPTVQISSPEDGHAFGAGEPLLVQGSASDERRIHAIRLEYWRLNDLVRAELATCPGCEEAASSDWSNEPPLQPGYYVVKAFAYDAAGNRSLSAAQRTFLVSGLPGVGIEPPGLPETPEAPEVPTLLEPDEGEVVPGAGGGTTIGGETEPGSTVHVYEEVAGVGPVGVVSDDDEDGLWQLVVTLPTGNYGIRTQAVDEDGNVSALSGLTLFEVDAELPNLGELTGDGAMFLPTQEVVIEGTVFDDRAALGVVLEYWLGDEAVLQELATCPTCPEQEAVWQHKPQGLDPGYYHVKVRAVDEAGQRSTVQVVTFTKLGL